MNGLRLAGLVRWLMVVSLLGCVTTALPPSESTISILQSHRNQLQSRVASGHLTPAQARELFYTKLAEIQPPLPDLGQLVEFRKQVAAEVEVKALTPEQAEAWLASRESEMMARWEEMADRYAREQRSFEQLKKEQERGFKQEQMPMNRPPRLPGSP